jgi:hypothetical protein
LAEGALSINTSRRKRVPLEWTAVVEGAYRNLERYADELGIVAHVHLGRRAARLARKGERVDVEALIEDWEDARNGRFDPRRWSPRPDEGTPRIRKLAALSTALGREFKSARRKPGPHWPASAKEAFFLDCLVSAAFDHPPSVLLLAAALAQEKGVSLRHPQRLADEATARFWALVWQHIGEQLAISGPQGRPFSLSACDRAYFLLLGPGRISTRTVRDARDASRLLARWDRALRRPDIVRRVLRQLVLEWAPLGPRETNKRIEALVALARMLNEHQRAISAEDGESPAARRPK